MILFVLKDVLRLSYWIYGILVIVAGVFIFIFLEQCFRISFYCIWYGVCYGLV